MKILEMMTSDPACCTPEATLRDVARMMVEYDCGEIPVCDSKDRGHIIGVITDRDIVCRAVAEGLDMSRTPVSTCMTTPAITLKKDATLEEAIELMETNMIRRLPITDKDGCVCGIVSQADIALKADSESISEVVREVSQPCESSSQVSNPSSLR
jgi:CBS domain-containing protein